MVVSCEKNGAILRLRYLDSHGARPALQDFALPIARGRLVLEELHDLAHAIRVHQTFGNNACG